MRRVLISIVLVAVTLALGGCVGDTDPATKVSIHSAQLNVHGYTNDGPATWWWQYAKDPAYLAYGNFPPYSFEVCGNGTGPKEPDNRCGPATGGSASNPIPLNVVLTGLEGGTTYYFRACGQDQNDSSPSCGRTLSFKTLAGTSYGFDRKWGSYGTANGQFNGPSGVATDASGNVYVADAGNHRIQKFGPSGNFIAKWGSFGSGDGKFKSPQGIATDGSYVYVADTGNNRIQKFSSVGGFVAKWGSSGSGDGQFNGPAGIGAKTNTVFVADGGNNRIQAFYAPDGSFTTKSGTFGSNNGQFKNPSGIAIDPWSLGGDIYVADAGNNRIQKFQPLCCFSTNFITKWGRNGGDGSPGAGDGEFNDPHGVAIGQFDNVYVADTGNNRIERFKPTQ